MADKQADIPARPKRVCVLGSTGSIGTQTLDVARRHPEFVKIVALSANTQAELLLEQAREFSVEHAVLANVEIAEAWRARFAEIGATLHAGSEAIVEPCNLPEVDMVVNSLVGAAGMQASYATLVAGKQLALANKESLVVGGDVLMPLSTHETLLPIDSEHGAISACSAKTPPRSRAYGSPLRAAPFAGRRQPTFKISRLNRRLAILRGTWVARFRSILPRS